MLAELVLFSVFKILEFTAFLEILHGLNILKRYLSLDVNEKIFVTDISFDRFIKTLFSKEGMNIYMSVCKSYQGK